MQDRPRCLPHDGPKYAAEQIGAQRLAVFVQDIIVCINIGALRITYTILGFLVIVIV